MQCQNNLKQLALACLSHEHANGKFPSGGWCYEWIGDASRGFGKKQPGSWVFSILPYMDNTTLFNMSASNSSTGQLNNVRSAREHVHDPADRDELSYAAASGGVSRNRDELCQSSRRQLSQYRQGRLRGEWGDSVYASSYRACDPGPTTLAEGDAAFAGARFQNGQSWGANYNVRGKNITTLLPPAWGPTPYNGIIFQNSEVTMGMITDGSSNTYLIGEKYCVQAFYATGNDTSDCETIYNGDDDDNERTAWCSPMQDTPDYYSESWGTPTTPSTISLYGSITAGAATRRTFMPSGLRRETCISTPPPPLSWV